MTFDDNDEMDFHFEENHNGSKLENDIKKSFICLLHLFTIAFAAKEHFLAFLMTELATRWVGGGSVVFC